MEKYVNLRCKTGDIYDGIIVDRIMRHYSTGKKAADNKQDAMGLADYGTMEFIPHFVESCVKNEVKALIGLECHIVLDNSIAQNFSEIPSITLFCKNEAGYKQLLKICNFLNDETINRKLRINVKELNKNYSANDLRIKYITYNKLKHLMWSNVGNLICILNFDNLEYEEKNIGIISKYIEKLVEVFGQENFYIGLNNKNEKFFRNNYSADKMVWAPEVKIYGDADEYDFFKKFRDKNVKNIEANADKNCTFRTGDEEYRDELKEVFENTRKIADSCNFSLTVYFNNNSSVKRTYSLAKENDGTAKLISIASKHKEFTIYGKTWSKFEFEIIKCLKERIGELQSEYIDRLIYEFKAFDRGEKQEFILNVAKIVKRMKERGILLADGSEYECGSLVLYALGITNVDPIKYRINFDIFYNWYDFTAPLIIKLDYDGSRSNEIKEVIDGLLFCNDFVETTMEIDAIKPNYVDVKNAVINSNDNKIKNMYIENAHDVERKFEMTRYLPAKKDSIRKEYFYKQNIDELIPINTLSDGRRHLVNYETNFYRNKFDCLKFVGDGVARSLQNGINVVKHNKNVDLNLNKIDLNDKKIYERLKEIVKNKETEEIGSIILNMDNCHYIMKMGEQVYNELLPDNFEELMIFTYLYNIHDTYCRISTVRDNKVNGVKVYDLDEKYSDVVAKTYGIAMYREQNIEIIKRYLKCDDAKAELISSAVYYKNRPFKYDMRDHLWDDFNNKIEETFGKEEGEKVIEHIEAMTINSIHLSELVNEAMYVYKILYLNTYYDKKFFG